MDEGVSIRAITIGVSVFIAIATISAVLTYYNTAKDAVRQIGSGNDIAGRYDKHIEETLLKTEINGTELKNILNYFHNRSEVIIVIQNLKILSGENIVSVNHTFSGNNWGSTYNQYLKVIFPNSKFTVNKDMSEGILKVTIIQNNIS